MSIMIAMSTVLVDKLIYFASDLIIVCNWVWHVSCSTDHLALRMLTHVTILYPMDNSKLETVNDLALPGMTEKRKRI